MAQALGPFLTKHGTWSESPLECVECELELLSLFLSEPKMLTINQKLPEINQKLPKIN